MNNRSKHFIRLLGENIAIQVISEDLGTNSIALQFPTKWAFQFADAFDEYFLEFTLHGLPKTGNDKWLYHLMRAISTGVKDAQIPYENFRTERRVEQSETVWITFNFEVNLYLAAIAIFEMLELYTEAWED